MSDQTIVYPLRPRGMLPYGSRIALTPLAWLYGAAANAVRAVGVLERMPTPDNVTVISVGNLEVGGNGKTPFCMYLLDEIRRRGAGAVFVSRGFRSRAERFGGVTIVAGQPLDPSPAPGTRQLNRSVRDLSEEIGDEPALVADRYHDVPLVVGSDKRAAMKIAVSLFAPDYVILDDAFQSWTLGRDVDVVLLDASRPFGGGSLLPSGSLREEPAALERADVVLFNGAATESAVESARRVVFQETGLRPPAAGVSRRLRVDFEPGARVVALSAIARPQAFEAMLGEAGFDVALAIRYPDHHSYCALDIKQIRRLAMDARCESIVTTEKDRVKLSVFGLEEPEMRCACLEIRLTNDAILEKILKPRTTSAASV